ncbi:MAG: metal ABC transporter permease, partial [Bacteroidales bacterium]|nr:metal ABC transporter permease [Bacteroidales bacterium]
MGWIEFIQELFTDYTSRTVILGTIVLGVVSGTLGTFAVLRKQSLLGDAISHASLPGIAIVFLLIGYKDPLLFLLGAIASGVIGTLWIRGIQQNTAIKSDTALGIILTVFFGLGIVLLTYIQRLPNANQAGLDSYLFGQA